MKPTTPVVIRIVARADGVPGDFAGRYVQRFVPSPKPLGTLTVTDTPAGAHVFAGPGEAFAFWKQTHGVRLDGKPNRPLTAYTVEIIPAAPES